MFRRLGQRFGRSKQKTRQLQQREFNELVGQDSTPQQVSSDSLRSLLKTAIADAEQIVASIKMRAQTEAEAEAARIIAQVKLEAQEIKGRVEIAAQKQAEDILSAANRKAEITVEEVKQKALQFLLMASEELEKEISEEYKKAYSRLSSSLQDIMSEGQNIGVELKDRAAKLWENKSFKLKEYEVALLSTSEAAAPPTETSAPMETQIEADIARKEKLEEPVQLQEEAVEAITEEHPPEERPDREEHEPAPVKLDSQAPYAGEVELIIAAPVELKAVSKLYNYLQTIPELRILYTRGSWDQGTTITVVLDKPMPLISLVSKTPGVEVTPELLEKDDLAKGRSSLLRAGGKGVKIIKLILKEAQPPVGG